MQIHCILQRAEIRAAPRGYHSSRSIGHMFDFNDHSTSRIMFEIRKKDTTVIIYNMTTQCPYSFNYYKYTFSAHRQPTIMRRAALRKTANAVQ